MPRLSCVTHAIHPRYRVIAPARLHLGFVDLQGGMGRRFGSLGLAINGLDAVVEAGLAPQPAASGEGASRVAALIESLVNEANADTGIELTVHSLPPAHAGLGSGTLLALTAGTACATALGLSRSPRDIAVLAGRGERSGIGIAAFEQGGFLLDGGRGPHSATPPLLSRLAFPAHWHCVLIFDERYQGLSGLAERNAFTTLPAMTDLHAGELSRRVLSGLLPAVADADFAGFGEHLGRIQQLVGDYFAPAQGGRFTSPEVGRVLEFLAHTFGLPGIGQSSWGPTGFIFTPDAATTAAVVQACQPRLGPGLRCLAVTAAALGARIEEVA